MTDLARERAEMVQTQLAERGIRDPNVLDAMGLVPRENFVPSHLQAQAYADAPLAIGSGQTISQPFVVARMIEAARLDAQSNALEIGAGSGYAAAIMGRIAARVVGIERHDALVQAARQRMADLGYSNVEIIYGDGSKGWAAAAPYDAIIVSAAADQVPEVLKNQLKIGGRLILPLAAGSDWQTLVCIRKISENAFEETKLLDVRFVPLISSQ